jgi:N4-(beta-N-acetylglucosaminyl)-L-asparaginase
MKRRDFLKSSLAASSLGGMASMVCGEVTGLAPGEAGEKPVLVSTWEFGKPANEAALEVLARSGTILDAVEQGIWVVESGPSNQSVGLSGIPNAAGVVQLDAAMMSGVGHRAGSVAALEGIRHPISAARRVMEKTAHVMLVGEGARMFALEEGLESVTIDSQARYEAWREKRAAERQGRGRKPAANHDTLALLVLGKDGSLAGGCSTSGLGGKLPGRVGDSPIIGGGLYVDNDVGAAGATGLGENIMRYCGSFMVVEYMRQGFSPEEACLETIRRICRREPEGKSLKINFIALDKQGRYGAASSDSGFPFAVATASSSRVLTSAGLGSARRIEGGNR